MFHSKLICLAVALAALALTTGAAAADPARAAIEPGIFRSDDGCGYVRAVGTTVYAFAEHPGKGYAFVLRGTLPATGSTASGGPPQARRSTKGSIELRCPRRARG